MTKKGFAFEEWDASIEGGEKRMVVVEIKEKEIFEQLEEMRETAFKLWHQSEKFALLCRARVEKAPEENIEGK